jgi:hypothetical protein
MTSKPRPENPSVEGNSFAKPDTDHFFFSITNNCQQSNTGTISLADALWS